MAKSKETFNKKELEKKRLKQRQEKREKMEERKANAQKGRSLDDMIAYVDDFGNLTSTPPDPKNRSIVNVEDIVIGVPKYVKDPADAIKKGQVSFFDTSKGFGFINEIITGARIFVHMSNITEPIKEADMVTFEVENGPRGLTAVNVKKAKK